MKLGQKQFSRIAPYFLAIVLKQLEKFTVYPVVKVNIRHKSTAYSSVIKGNDTSLCVYRIH